MMRRHSRVALPKTEQPQKQTRRRDRIERPAPAPKYPNRSSNNISDRATHRNSGTKKRKHPTPRFDRVKISQDGRCGGSVTSFADSNTDSSGEKHSKSDREARGAARQTPQDHG